MKVFVFDHDKCNGCRNCQIACKDEHCGNDWMPYAKPQPQTGQFWIKVNETVRGQVPKVKASYTVSMCHHCDNASCLKEFPEAVSRREDGLVVIDPVAAEGKRGLVDACPFHAIFWNDELGIAQKCTGCAHLLDDGWEAPRCVEACPHGALRFGEEGDFAEELAGLDRDRIAEDSVHGSHFICLNLPKRFVAGQVIDPAEDEVVIGAKVTLSNAAGVVETVETDDFGDFWFKRVDPDAYVVTVEADGFAPLAVEADAVERDLNVGMLELA